jgi:hypothetical protein
MGKRMFVLSGIYLFALTLTFAGCGKKEEPAPPPPPPAPAPSAPAPSAPAPTEPAAPPAGEQKPADGGAAKPEKEMEKKEEGKTK